MFFVLFYSLSCFFLTILLTSLTIISYKSLKDKEKTSPFECGFDPNNISRLPFCLKFFLMIVVFLVFDVEVALLLPFIFASFSLSSFIIVLTVGTFYEWAYGGLNWMV